MVKALNMIHLLLFGIISSSKAQILQCSNNYTASIDSNPALYFSLVTESLNIGLLSYEITTEQSKLFTSSFSHKVITENKKTAGAEFNANGLLSIFNIGAQASMEFVSMTKAENLKESTTSNSWARTIKGSYSLGKGNFFLTAAEMKLYVFIDHEGVRRKVSLPTGRLQQGAFNKENLNSWILDKSFEGLMRSSGWQLPTYSLDDIETLVYLKNKNPTLPRAPFPDPSLLYYIENTQYPGSMLHGMAVYDKEQVKLKEELSKLDDLPYGMLLYKNFADFQSTSHLYSSCGPLMPDHTVQMAKWRFQPVGNSYFIHSTKFPNSRLFAKKQKIGIFDGKISDDQKWRITFEGGNKVRLSNISNGHKLAQWSRGYWPKDNMNLKNYPSNCGVYNGRAYDDQIWKLIVA